MHDFLIILSITLNFLVCYFIFTLKRGDFVRSIIICILTIMVLGLNIITHKTDLDKVVIAANIIQLISVAMLSTSAYANRHFFEKDKV